MGVADACEPVAAVARDGEQHDRAAKPVTADLENDF
jgi:hypothetical protein